MSAAPKKFLLQTLTRGLDVLNALADSQDGLRSTDVANKFNLNLNTAGRLLSTLEAAGYAARSNDGYYTVGAAVISAAIKKVNIANLSKASRSMLKHLRDKTCETVFLVTRVGHSLVIVDSLEGTHDLRVVLKAGGIASLFPATTGYALTVDIPSAEVVALSKKMGDSQRAVTEADVIQARQELKKRGYLIRHASLASAGTCTIASTVRLDGKAIASIGIAGPSERWNEKTVKPYIKDLLDATNELSRRISNM